MVDESGQWDFGSPFKDEEDTDQSEEDKEQEEQRRYRREDPRKRLRRRKKKIDRSGKGPQKPTKPIKQPGKPIKAPTQAAKGASRVAKSTGRAVKATARVGRQATQATIRSAKIATDVAVKAAEATVRTAIAAAQAVSNAVTWLVAGAVSWWWLIVIGIIVLVIVFTFLSGSKDVSSLAGGSITVEANSYSVRDQAIVESLINKMEGDNPKLVIYQDGKNDIDWQCETDDTRVEICNHLLDIRLLKTLDYLTDIHERIEVGLLKTGAPDLLRESFLDKLSEYSDENEDSGSSVEIEEDQKKIKETISAFYNGQAMAIVAIDYSKIRELPPNTPIKVGWQKTLAEKTIRPVWEEISFNAGFLDENIPNYERVLGDGSADALAQQYKVGLIVSGYYSLYEETFEKISRIVVLLERINGDLATLDSMDSRTIEYFVRAQEFFDELDQNIGDPSIMLEEDIANRIVYLGEATELIRNGVKYIYKATQVANMVNWNRSGSQLEFKQAYEARNKVRQVIKELLEMPREISLSGEDQIFDQGLMVKQIITFSPEDDFDNGLERLDIFPEGIVSVDVGGVGMKTTGEPETDEDGQIIDPGYAIGDGIYSYEDVHFSHAPIDNGVFSKHGTNYIYRVIDPNDPLWGQAGGSIFETSSTPGSTESSWNILHDLFVGDCVIDTDEVCKKITYKDFLHVSF